MAIPANASLFGGPGHHQTLLQLPSGIYVFAQADNSGNLLVNVAAGGGAGGTSSTFGAGFPGTGTAAGASDGTNMQPLLVDGSGNLKVAGSFSASQPTSSAATAVAQTAVGTTSGSVLASNPSAKGRHIKNTGTTVIKIGLNRTPTQTAYHISLAPGAFADDGAGEEWDGTMSGTLFTQAINAISSAAGGTCVVTELT